jgi:hypothetical protein
VTPASIPWVTEADASYFTGRSKFCVAATAKASTQLAACSDRVIGTLWEGLSGGLKN